MRVFVNARFRAFMDDHDLAETSVCRAAMEVASGLIHANLGGGVYKQRVARRGQGKSGGFRTILFFRREGHTFFIDGFAKNERDNISTDDLTELKLLAKEIFTYGEDRIRRSVAQGVFEEICRQASL